MKLSLYARNTLQVGLFQGIARSLSQRGVDVDLLLPHLGESREQESIFYPEKEISDLITRGSIDTDKQFSRICSQYKNINRIIQSERELNYYRFYFGVECVNRAQKIQFLVYAFLWFEYYISKFTPNVVISEMVTGLFDGAFKEVCNYNNIKYIGIRSSKLRPGIVFCDDVFDEPTFLYSEYRKSMLDSFDEISNATSLLCRKLMKKDEVPHYMEVTGKRFKILSMSVLRSAYNLLIKRPKLPQHSIQQYAVLNAFKEKIIRFSNIQHDYYRDKDINTAKNYFVYAAHFEPEASVHVRAHNHADQLGLIKQISRLLPPDSLLVVKEHRGNIGFRRKEFYRELSHLYNVVLASPGYSLQELVAGSHAVITLTGRIGLEALLLGVPVLAFGKSFWTQLNGVIREDSPGKLASVLIELLIPENIYKKSINIKSTYALIKSYDRLTYEGCFTHGAKNFSTQENVDTVAHSIQLFINSLKLVDV